MIDKLNGRRMGMQRLQEVEEDKVINLPQLQE